MKPFEEPVTYGKAHPDTLNFAFAGIGTTPHLTGEMCDQRTGIEATHVPYKALNWIFGKDRLRRHLETVAAR